MKQFIENRKGQKVCVVLENESGKGLAFIMHSFGGDKEQSHVRTFAQAFTDKDFKVVLFDTTNTFGESDGEFSKSTITTFFEDLEDVISWAKKQDWYEEPFYLAGHSLGGISTALYAEKYPSQIKGLAPISTVVSGKLSLESPKSKDWKEWKEKEEKVYTSSNGREKRIPWSHYEDRLKYDLIPDSKNLTMPVLLIVGDKDKSTPREHQQIFFDALSTDKEMHIIKNAPHTFKDEEHLKEIKELFLKWIEKVEQK